jgi:hypothetical protein
MGETTFISSDDSLGAGVALEHAVRPPTAAKAIAATAPTRTKFLFMIFSFHFVYSTEHVSVFRLWDRGAPTLCVV